MTTKYLYGAYAAGYSLASTFNEVKLEPAGLIEGSGLSAAQAVTLVNYGRILSEAGTAGASGHFYGGQGSAGADVASSGSVINVGTIRAGGGGAGAYNSANSYAYGGGQGGAGLTLGGVGTGVNTGVIEGGAGGIGSHGGPGNYGAGGYGGDGVVFAAGGRFINRGLVSGGAGGDSLFFGGWGGDGVALLGAGTAVNAGGTILGGAGGTEQGTFYGGRGRSAIVATQLAFVSNTGLVRGGQGGASVAAGGFGAAGGAGVSLVLGGTIANWGSIIGGAGGGDTIASGYVAPGGTGGRGVYAEGPLRITNSGVMRGGAGDFGGEGVFATQTATVVNRGTITGGAGSISGGAGVDLSGQGLLVNFGTIVGGSAAAGQGSPGDGVDSSYGGTLLNARGASISGNIGVSASSFVPITVINGGTILGASYAVRFNGVAQGSKVVVEAGASFIGEVNGGGVFIGGQDVGGAILELAGGSGSITGLSGAGTLSGSDTASFEGFGTYVIDAGGHWTLTGANSLSSSYRSLIDKGQLIVAGTLDEVAGASIVVDGFTTVTGSGELFSGAITGSGTVLFRGGSDTFDGTQLSAKRTVVEGAAVTLEGAIANTGLIQIASEQVSIGSGGATLTGSGSLAFNNFATNSIVGSGAGGALTVAAATISGAGHIGGGGFTLINQAGGVIDGNLTRNLLVDVGSETIVNDGVFEATGAGGLTIASAVSGSGRLVTTAGTLALEGAVASSEVAEIDGGALVFNSTFNGNVAFEVAAGVLGLDSSQTYGGTISGFGQTAGQALDLGDVAFTGSHEASFSGNAAGGVLTVSDGAHTAKLHLAGNYLNASFVTATDGHGGVIVTLQGSSDTLTPSHHSMAAAMAGMAASSGHGTGPSALAWAPAPERLAILAPATR